MRLFLALFLLLILSAASAGCIATDPPASSSGLETSPLIADLAFAVDGHTTILPKMDVNSQEFYETYGPLNLAPGITDFYLVTFDKPVAQFDEAIVLDFTIYGKSYHRVLKRFDGTPEPDIVTYQGRLVSDDASTTFFITFGPGNMLITDFSWNGTYVEVTPVQNRTNAQSATHPLHAVYELPKPKPVNPLPGNYPRPAGAVVNTSVPAFSIPGMTTSLLGQDLTGIDLLDEYGLSKPPVSFSGRNYFTFNNTIPFDDDEYIFRFSVNGKSCAVPMKNLHQTDYPDIVQYAGRMNPEDPDTIFSLTAGPGNRISTSFVLEGVPYRVEQIYSDKPVKTDHPLHIARSYYESIDAWAEKGSAYPQNVPPLPGELRLTQTYLSCSVGEIILAVPVRVYDEFPKLREILQSTHPLRTAVISETPVEGYDVHISPADAEKLFDTYGSRPSQDTSYWVNKYLSMEDGMFILEKGGIGLSPSLYPW